MSSPYSVPPRWNPQTHYPAGSLVWYSGCYWRSEQSHQSSDESSGAPTGNTHLWTPVAVTAPPGSNAPPAYHMAPQPQPSGSYSQAPPYTAQYASHHMLQSDFSSNSPSGSGEKYNEYDDDSPSSQGTVTEKDMEKEVTTRGSMHHADSAGEAVIESMRFVVAQKEKHQAKSEDELKAELKGKRVWSTGGLGIWAYHQDDEDEELKRKVWRDFGEKHGKDEWLKAARQRTEFYSKESRGVKPLMKWKLVERGGYLPDDALPMGHEADGTMLYVARAWHEGGLHLGKAGPHLINHASISWGGQEHTVDIYEVLCGPSDGSALQWRIYNHGENARVDGWQPVEGGRERDGLPLLIAKGEYENGVHPGKCLINDDHACVGYGGGELWVRPFQVLAYSSSRR